MTTLYGIRTCDTIKKARAWLTAKGVAHDFHDYKVAGIDRRQLRDWADRIGWERLLNRSGTTFRKLPESDRAAVDEAHALALMLEYPSLIRRPVLVNAETLLVGFDPVAYARALLPA